MYTSEWSDEGRAVAFMSAAALHHNLNEIRRRLTPGMALCGVVKADAYGHGAVPVAARLKKAGVPWLAVATAAEAMELRLAGVAGPLLVMGAIPAAFAAEAAAHGISLTVQSESFGRRLQDAAKQAGVQLGIHIKLDTGMTRLGFSTAAADAAASAAAIKALFADGWLQPEGLSSHFAVSESDDAFTASQTARYLDMLARLDTLTFQFRHLANSGGCEASRSPFNMCRTGIMLYGGQPDPERPVYDLKPVMSVFGRIVQIRRLSQTETVGYGRTASMAAGSRLAVVEIGYADGVPRHLSGCGHLLVGGRRAPIIGRVSMDRIVLDVTGLDSAAEGHLALYFGQDGTAVLPADDVARQAGTIAYELFCRISGRVPRVWRD